MKFLFFSFLLLSSNISLASIPKLDNYKILPHWIVGCDNQNLCTSVGYPQQGNDYVEQEWYLFAKWHRQDAQIVFEFYPVAENHRDFDSGKIKLPSMYFCINDGACEIDKINMIVSDVVETPLIIKFSSLSENSYIHVEYNNKPYKLYPYEMVEYASSLHIDLPVEDKNIIPWQEVRQISYSEIREIFKNFEPDKYCLHDDLYLENNIFIRYENGDEFIFSCANGGEHYNAYKKIEGTYHDFVLLDEKYQGLTGNILVNGSIIKRFNDDDPKGLTLHLTNSHGLWFCGFDYFLAYDGQAFIIDSVQVMPLCMNIEKRHWISLYKNSKNQEEI